MLLTRECSLAEKHAVGKKGADELETVSLVVVIPKDPLPHTVVHILLASRATNWHKVSIDESDNVLEQSAAPGSHSLCKCRKVFLPTLQFV